MNEPALSVGLLRRISKSLSRAFAGPLCSCPLLATVAVLLAAPALPAQTAGTGTIEGRVQNAITGDYLNNARVAVKGTNLVALTDSAGYYRLTAVPAGEADLRVFFTGLDEQEVKVTVAAGGTQTTDFKLTSVARYGKDAETVTLDTYVVQATKETNAAAIAVNEQRVALGQKSVVSSDQFGTIPDANPGELMKWLPGVSVEYFANNIIGVSVRGLDAANTEILYDGMPVASASTATASTPGRGRNFEMLGASAADIARVEIRKLRTPEDSANALGGSINLVRRTAFEADKRRYTYNVFFTSDAEEFGLSRRAGIRDTQMQGWRPNLKFTLTDPVSKTFGYALTLNHNDVLARVHWSAPSMNFGTVPLATAAAARVAAGQPLTTVSVYNPLVTQDLVHDNPIQNINDSASLKLDWRPSPNLKLSYALSAARFQERVGDEVRFTWSTGAQTNPNLNAVLGTPGTNTEGAVYGNLGTGAIRYDMREAWRNGIKPVLTNALEAEWDKGDWTVSAKASYSMSRHTFRDTEDGFFGSTTMNGSTLPNTGIGIGTANPRLLTVNLLDRTSYIAQTVKSYAHTAGATTLGPEVDWQNLDNMYIGGAVSRPGKTLESIAALRLWARHDFRFTNPLSIRVGFDYDEQFRNVQKYDANLWTFVGADGLARTADDRASLIAAVNVEPARDSHYNSPVVTRISMRRLYDLYRTNPSWFEPRAAESYRFSNTEPYELNEQTTAFYLQFSGAFLRNRLTYIGGVRYEKAEAWGLGSRDNGSSSIVGITDPLLQARARYVRKGARGQGENDGMFPSLELNYNLRKNLILRAGYARTQAKNRFSRSVIPSSTFDFTPPTGGAFAGIALGSVNRPNPALLPWTADNYEAHLEYYTPQGGVISVGGFLKQIQNVQVSQTILLDSAESLAALDLDPSFLNFRATTWINQGVGQISGLEAEIRQPLDAWVPELFKGFTLTGSANTNHLSKFTYLSSPTGNQSTDFSNFYETQYKTSLGYRRGKLGANLGFIYYGKVYRQRNNVTTGTESIRGDQFYPPYTTLDFNLEYSITRWAKLFLSGRNVTNAQKLRQRVLVGAPEWSHFQIANNLGVTYTAGITGSF